MANKQKLIAGVQPHLEPGETVEASVAGSYETKIMGNDSVRAGVLAATDRRVVFYAKKLGGYDLESFAYGKISSFEQSKNMMGHVVTFFASGNKASMKWISDLADLQAFVTAVKGHMSSAGSATSPDTAVPVDLPAAPAADVFAQLRQLGQLRDAGIVSDEEFASKKAELLARM